MKSPGISCDQVHADLDKTEHFFVFLKVAISAGVTGNPAINSFFVVFTVRVRLQ